MLLEDQNIWKHVLVKWGISEFAQTAVMLNLKVKNQENILTVEFIQKCDYSTIVINTSSKFMTIIFSVDSIIAYI